MAVVTATFKGIGAGIAKHLEAAAASVAVNYGARKLRVNSVNPGPSETDGVHAQRLIDKFQELGGQTLLGRIGQPDGVAPAVVYLASDDAAWVTGETHNITGGVR